MPRNRHIADSAVKVDLTLGDIVILLRLVCNAFGLLF